jgi:hypothetical protein
MSNVTQPFGLRPIRMYNGSPWNGQTQKCFCSADYATALYVGDPVIISPTAAEDDATNTHNYPKINVATGGDTVVIYGVITSFDADPDRLTYQYRPASTERIANVCTDYSVVYEIRGCGGGTPATDWISRNAVLYAGSASTVTGLSGFQLDEGTSAAPAADMSYQLRIIGRKDTADNTIADYCVWEVLLNTPNTTGLVLGVSDA